MTETPSPTAAILEDTIAAVATAVGEAGLAVIRLSGPAATAIVDRCFKPGGRRSCPASVAPSHTIQYGHIWHQERIVDEVLVSVMRAPRTFTREDVVEVTCHGGVLCARLVLEAVLSSGARLAEPGEFTRRAFLSGRIDLAQAEAVADVIRARTDLALAAAHEQLAGKLSRHVNELRDELMLVLAHVEAHIDFPDEDIAPEAAASLVGRLQQVLRRTDELLRTAREGQILRCGIRAVIVGRPNVGKSSLLNQLLARDRAIVSPTPGTTRDTIEETANIRGIPVVLVDTAGIRRAADPVEQEGVRRSKQVGDVAEVMILVLDGAEPFTEEDRELLAGWRDKRLIVVRNKADQPRQCQLPLGQTALDISCVTGEGVETLKDRIRDLVWSGSVDGAATEMMINARHQEVLRRARVATEQALAALGEKASPEFVALEVRIAANAVGEIVGKTSTEDLLDTIFSQFCLGK